MNSGQILLSRAHYPVTVLGYGKRLGLWLQGCSIGCKGCISKDTWAFDEMSAINISDLLSWARETCGDDFDGVTISGGEPFDQPEALEQLLLDLRCWIDSLKDDQGRDRDILCYSGYPLKRLKRDHKNLLNLLDVVVSDPFVESKPTTYLRGSDNQHLVLFSSLAVARYKEYATSTQPQRMQLHVDRENRMWAIGIPDSHDMQRMTAHMAEQGFAMHDVSWQA